MTTRAQTSSPPSKRIKLEADESALEDIIQRNEDEDLEIDEDHCSICLQSMADRTVIPPCSHEFCFECLLIWTGQSRRCPLCSQTIGEYLIHHIRSKYDFQKHYLTPLRTSPQPQSQLPPSRGRGRGLTSGRPQREVEWGRNGWRAREREAAAIDDLERAIDQRRWVYRNKLYAKHVASNSFTRYRPFPTPTQFAANQDLITRATIFVRRELRVWGGLDVEFLTTFTISLMKSLSIRSEPAVKLLGEFLDMDAEHDVHDSSPSTNPRANAEHFAHELYCYLRSPYRDLATYDSVVQYDVPEHISQPNWRERSSRWRSASRSRSPRSRSRTRSHSHSPSPSHHRPQREVNGPSSPKAISRSHSRPQIRNTVDVITDRRRLSSISPTRKMAHAAASSSRNTVDESKRNDNAALRHIANTDEEIHLSTTGDPKGKGRAEPLSQFCLPLQDDGVPVPDPSSPRKSSSIIGLSLKSHTSPSNYPREGDSTVHCIEGRRPRIRKDTWSSVQALLTDATDDHSHAAKRPIREGLSIKGAAGRALASADSSQFTPPGDSRHAGMPLLQRLSSSESIMKNYRGHVQFPPGQRKSHHSTILQTDTAEITSHMPSEGERAVMETGNHNLPPRSDLNGTNGILRAASRPLRANPVPSTPRPSNNSKERSPSRSDLRARLFSKLEVEKQAQKMASVGISGSMACSSAPEENYSKEADVVASTRGQHVARGNEVVMDAEESLRRQVRLRARLAAERRLGNVASGAADAGVVASTQDEGVSDELPREAM
ncbi:hypothetical protein BXZ70DRAFT_504836 [Cristinia sonorae]|uniref:RING-type E3 ubiquitin transferase n=1 Tax=Cristinia sonorae TaxID=1940300 RepID=A0A8K0XT08_9AGAR|nr:hypothetical protein BXZ70DRAFT_504836 [Cristinia sonorae]